MVFGADRPCDLCRIRQFAEFCFPIPYRKSLHWSRGLAPDQCRDGTRINTAAQEHSEWHIAHEAGFYCFFQALAAFLDPVPIRTDLGLLRIRNVPILHD